MSCGAASAGASAVPCPAHDHHHEVPMIAYYNQKGGVGKTTNVHSHARSLAETYGLKVLAVDCDPQRNLTHDLCGNVIDAHEDGMYNTWINRPGRNPAGAGRTLVEVLQPLMGDVPNVSLGGLAPVELYRVPDVRNGEIWLLCGDEDMTSLDEMITKADSLNAMVRVLRNNFAMPYYAVMHAARTCSADIVLLDLSPNNGPLNKVLLLTSSHFITPSNLDKKSLEGIVSICNNLTNKQAKGWCHWAHFVACKNSVNCAFPFPQRRPKFLGWTLNDYSVTKRGEIQDGIRQDELARNNNGFFNTLCNKVMDCARLLQDMSQNSPHTFHQDEDNTHQWTVPTLHVEMDRYIQAKEIPPERQAGNNQLLLLGRTSSYNKERIVAQHFNKPVEFLRDDQMHTWDHNPESETYGNFVPLRDVRQRSKMRHFVSRNKEALDTTVKVILKLLRTDFPRLPDEPFIPDDHDRADRNRGAPGRRSGVQDRSTSNGQRGQQRAHGANGSMSGGGRGSNGQPSQKRARVANDSSSGGKKRKGNYGGRIELR